MNYKHQEIIESIRKIVVGINKNPLFVVFTGDSGSGKSYFSDLFKNNLNTSKISYTYINADDFLIPRKDREPMKRVFYSEGPFKGKSYWEILENMFNLKLFTQVVESLKSHKDAIYYPYDRATGDISKIQKTVKYNDLVVVDSSMLLDKMDFIILIEVSRGNILKRKVERDSDIRSKEEIITMHQKVQGAYLDRMKPNNPDIIINNDDINNPILEITNNK